MGQKYFKPIALIIIVGLIFLSHITRQVQAQEIKQWHEGESSGNGQTAQEQTKQERKVESLSAQEHKNKEREDKRENLLKRYLTDVLELKNGNKIFGRVTGSASGAVTMFNMETGEEEAIFTDTISSQRKTAPYEVQAVIDELRDRGREDEMIPILNKRKESEYGLSDKIYDEQVKSADRARVDLDKRLDRAHKEEREDVLAARARAEYLEDRRANQTNIDNARRSQQKSSSTEKPLATGSK